MKITVNGEAIIFTSTAKMDDLRLVEKNAPDALRVMGGKDGEDEVFRIGTGESGRISSFGAIFSGIARDGSGCATITERLSDPELSGDELKEYIADVYGAAVAHINEIEGGLADAVEKVKTAKKAVTDAITIV